MKNKIVLLFFMSVATITPILAETKTNTAQTITTKDIMRNQTGENNENTPSKNKCSWENAREAIATIKDIMISLTSLYVILYIIDMSKIPKKI